MQFKRTLFFLFSYVAFSLASSANDVVNDAALALTQLNTVVALLAALPAVGITLAQALAVQTASLVFQGTLDKTTSDVVGLVTPVTEAEGRLILDSFKGLETGAAAASAALIAKKTAISLISPIGLPIGGPLALVRQNLASMKTKVNTLEDALEAAAPESLLAEGNALRDSIDFQLDAAINAYA